MNERNLEPITARLGVDCEEKGVLGFFFLFFLLFSEKERFCFLSAGHAYVIVALGLCFGSFRRSEGSLPTAGGNFYPSDLLCLGRGEGVGLEARQSSCYCSSWQQSGWVIYMFNHTKSAENYLAEFRWPNSVCVAQHFLFILFPTV